MLKLKERRILSHPNSKNADPALETVELATYAARYGRQTGHYAAFVESYEGLVSDFRYMDLCVFFVLS